MTHTVIAEPRPPQHPLPAEVTEALYRLLGIGMWIAATVILASMIVAGGFCWVWWQQGSVGKGAKKIGWILAAAWLAGAAWLIAGFVLGR